MHPTQTAPAGAPSTTRTRDPRLDVLKGVLIAGVVLGHFLETSGGQAPGALYSGWDAEPQRAVLTMLYVFHMPLFVLLAGITASPRRRGHRVAQMVGLYVVLQVSYLLLRGDALSVDALLHPVYGMWFLLAMAWWLAVLPLVQRLGRWALPVATVVSLVAVTLPAQDPTLASWARAACYWPFFVAGHLYGRTLLRRAADAGPALVGPALTVLVGVTTAVLAWGVDPRWYRGADTAGTMGDTPFDALAVRVVCFGAAVLCSVALLALVPGRQRLLETLGRRSLAIYALHVPLVFAAQAWFEGRGIGVWTASAIALAMTVASLAVLVHPWFDAALRRVGTLAADAITTTVGAHRPVDAGAALPHHPDRQPGRTRPVIL